jgi:phage terminase large subunit
MFIYTTAIKKLRKLVSRVRIVPGGTSAGKTYGIIPVLIDQAARVENLEISIVSESVPHLRKGALKDFLKIMKETGRYNDNNYNRTLLTYTFATGSYIEFFSADQESRVRGPRRNILYINECNNLTFETYHQLAIRTDMTIWLDFNPSNEFWVHTELGEDDDAETLVLTYKDNEGLNDAIIKEIEKGRKKAYHDEFLPVPALFAEDNIKNHYWDNWWRVYGLGMLGKLEGVIFENWSIIDSVPRDAVLIGRGQDYGFTNDPTTMIAAYRWRGSVIWDEEIYQRGMTNGDIAGAMKSVGVKKLDYVVGDRVVDIGPGGGALMDLMEKTFVDKEILGIDISSNVIETLEKKKLKENHKWNVQYGDALDLKTHLEPSSVATIIFCSIIHEFFVRY